MALVWFLAGISSAFAHIPFSISIASQSFDGKLDDMRYYNRALSDAEIAGVYGLTSTNRICFADALGSVVALADSTGNIVTRYGYEPFGATTTTGPATKNSYKFTSREDDGTGMYYTLARYYHPALGRFMSEDPLGELDGMNVFGYVGNNPMNFFDSYGLLKSGCEELRRLRETYEYKNVIERYRQIYRNHTDGGRFDYVKKETSETFSLEGQVKTSHEFGNYTAGYSAGYAGRLQTIDYLILRVEGRAYGALHSIFTGEWHASQLYFWGDDWISVREITMGYYRGFLDRFLTNPRDCGKCQ
jgi:RHS repeat-associated protein